MTNKKNHTNHNLNLNQKKESNMKTITTNPNPNQGYISPEREEPVYTINKELIEEVKAYGGWTSEEGIPGIANNMVKTWAYRNARAKAIYRKGESVDQNIPITFPNGGYRILNPNDEDDTDTDWMQMVSWEAETDSRPDNWENKLGDIEQDALGRLEEKLQELGAPDSFLDKKCINLLRNNLVAGKSTTRITNDMIKYLGDKHKVYISKHRDIKDVLDWWKKTLQWFQDKDVQKEQREEPPVKLDTTTDDLELEAWEHHDWYDAQMAGPDNFIQQDRVKKYTKWMFDHMAAMNSRKLILETGHKMLKQLDDKIKEGKRKPLALRDRHRLWGVVIAMADRNCPSRPNDFSVLGDVSVVLNGPKRWYGYVPASDRPRDLLYNGMTESYKKNFRRNGFFYLISEEASDYSDVYTAPWWYKSKRSGGSSWDADAPDYTSLWQKSRRISDARQEYFEKEKERAEQYWDYRTQCGANLISLIFQG